VSLRPTAPGPRYALLVSEYPTVSHTFIEREVSAVRALGGEVSTFSVRPSSPAQALSEHARAELAGTTTLLGRPVGEYLRVHGWLALRNPRAWVSALLAAARRGPGTAKATLWQVFYFVEAGVLVAEMRRRRLRHVHVHFANNGADVARTAVDLASRTEAGWSWSLAMHGPGEFEDVLAFDLAAKVRSAAFVACISDFCRSQLMRHVEPEHWDKLHLVRMGVDASRYLGRADQRAARPPGALRVLFVGRLVPEKGPTVLVEAVRMLADDGRDVELVLVGAGDLGTALRAQVQRDGLQSRVVLAGAVGQDDLPELYAWADDFCLPSFAEGVPVVLMEAMATELPVVTTRIAGIPELVVDGEHGRLVTPGRSDELAAALLEVGAAGRDRTRRWGVNGRTAVQQGFDPVVHAAVLVRLVSAVDV
jgi:colanic acid/amylovoran biosynthesis glycosyltransferase